MQTGSLFIISAPSGAGKTSVVKAVVSALNDVSVSISHTTRAPRPGEVEGLDYHFVDKATFTNMESKQLFLESAEVYGNFYGTSRVHVEKMCGQGIDIILEIDWQGARQVREVYGDAVSIFILPPCLEDLSKRLVARKQDCEEVIQRRLSSAKEDISHYLEYDYIIINRVIAEAIDELSAVIRARRLWRRAQKTYYDEFINKLIG